jgi:hypothetical protein
LAIPCGDEIARERRGDILQMLLAEVAHNKR